MERRGRENKRAHPSALCGHGSNKTMTMKLMRLKHLAKDAPEMCFNNVQCIITAEFLEIAFHRLDARKAVGVDGVSKALYARNLKGNLADLETRIRRKSYKPLPARQVLIPKANGKTRAIAVSALEDKVVQMAVAMILEAVFEPLFCEASTGFRLKRGSHGAFNKVYQLLRGNHRPYVVDCDIKSFFDVVNHERLMEFVGKRVSDKHFTFLLKRLLKAGTMTTAGEKVINEVGTPQGSVVSPILANIYLHYVIDKWFEETQKTYSQQMVRYADDVVFCFHDRQAAEALLRTLKERLKENHLELNEDKTKIVEFQKDGGQTFDFMGFTYYWGRSKEKLKLLKAKTSAGSLRRAIAEFKLWIKTERHRYGLKALWKKAEERMKGHYAYFGVTMNNKLWFFYHICLQLLYKWLNRRSQRKSFCWKSFRERLRRFPLPKPWGCDLVNIRQYVFDFAI